MSTEKINWVSKLKHWSGDLNVEKYVFTVGVAGERFFRKLKEGKLLASRCDKCGTKFFPARSYCERCHSEIKEYYEINNVGKVYTYTIQRKDKNGKKLEKPVIWAIIKFDDMVGGLLHKLEEVEEEDLEIGIRVKPVFKKPEEREGKITDILYFKPI